MVQCNLGPRFIVFRSQVGYLSDKNDDLAVQYSMNYEDVHTKPNDYYKLLDINERRNKANLTKYVQ